MEAAIILVFVMGYLAITLEHSIKIDKLIPALVMMAICWALIALGLDSFPQWFDSGKHALLENFGLLGHEEKMHLMEETLLHHLGKTSEILGAFLSVTFIVASGLVRTVGQWLLVDMQVSEYWMPATTGAIFIVPLFVSVFFLSQTPAPSIKDKLARQVRAAMNGQQRLKFFLKYAPGLILLVTSFLLFTGLRDFRDNFSAEIWQALGYGEEPAIFTYAGIRIAGVVLIVLAAMVMVKDNVKAFLTNHGFILLGCCLLGLTTFAFQQQWIDGKSWMVWLGTGLYIAYIPYNCFLFDRMISAVGSTANAGFLIYLADSAGYVGSVSILLYRTFASPDISWLNFFIQLCYFVAIAGGVLVCCSLAYFGYKLKVQKQINAEAPQHQSTKLALGETNI